jgi:hypothetical protein
MITSFIFQTAGAFPLEEIRAYLDALPTVRRDRWDDAVYIFADDDATLRRVVDARENSEAIYPRIVSLVRLYDARIDFSLQTRDVQTVREFARWVRRGYDITIQNDAFKDITAECDDNLDHLFGKLQKRRLTSIGFFRELKHGHPDGPSLRDAMRESGKPGESRTAAYLRDAPILLHALGPVTDVFQPKGEYICAPNIHTDGVYAWPEDLAYYVERYHVDLPAEFLKHIAAAKWKAPADIDITVVALG